MPSLIIDITRLLSDAFPCYVECLIRDAEDRDHVFCEKIPVVSGKTLGELPARGRIACEVEEKWTRSDGQVVLRVNTGPHGVQSTAGLCVFVVFDEQVSLE